MGGWVHLKHNVGIQKGKCNELCFLTFLMKHAPALYYQVLNGHDFSGKAAAALKKTMPVVNLEGLYMNFLSKVLSLQSNGNGLSLDVEVWPRNT